MLLEVPKIPFGQTWCINAEGDIKCGVMSRGVFGWAGDFLTAGVKDGPLSVVR